MTILENLSILELALSEAKRFKMLSVGGTEIESGIFALITRRWLYFMLGNPRIISIVSLLFFFAKGLLGDKETGISKVLFSEQ